ncbi:HAD family hydrolase [Paenibacillaceae bacterium]|nr:HAD family hydrolase [Paenibacillaceae bacterium]
MKQTILFDLDDTLIHCNKYFYLTIDKFIAQMEDWFSPYGIEGPDIRKKQMDIDVQAIHLFGFKRDHFPESFIEAYRFYCDQTGRKRLDTDEKWLWTLGRGVFDAVAEPYPYMQETLDKLASDGHELHLYTGGELFIQHRKIERLQLERYFESRIYVRQHKNNEALENILAEGRFDRDHTWMIGNSIRTDIVPALTAGIHAIHMKSEAEWSYNVIQIDVQPRGAFFTLQKLIEVPDTIHQYVRR